MVRRSWLTGKLGRGALLALGVIGVGLFVGIGWQSAGRLNFAANGERRLMANGWTVAPVGSHLQLPGDMPGSVVVFPGDRYAVVNTCGYHDHSLNLIDLQTMQIVQSFNLGENFIGMAYSARRQELFISGGGANGNAKGRDDRNIGEPLPASSRGALLRFGWDGTKLTPKPGITWPNADKKHSFVSGILVDDQDRIVMADTQQDQLVRLSGPDLATQERIPTGYRPYGLASRGSELAVSLWGDKSVEVREGESLTLKRRITVGAHPSSLAYLPSGRLAIAEAGESSVAISNGRKIVQRVVVSLNKDALIGATPLALEVSGSRLYVADADNNCLSVLRSLDNGDLALEGFIPTGRYPSVVRATKGRLLVGTAKGLAASASIDEKAIETLQSKGVSPDADIRGRSAGAIYIGKLLTGHLTMLEEPTAEALPKLTAMALAGLPKHPETLSKDEKTRILKQVFPKIEHVVYVIKENRSYDQVFGDMPEGNGDSRLTLFPERITPNQHALARRHVLLDNLYCDGEVSQVGHQWTDAGYANDYCEKNWTINYSGRGEIESDTRMFTSPAGYIWQHAKRHGKSTRIYGEYLEWQEDHDSAKGEVKANPEKFGASKEWDDLFAADKPDTDKVAVFLKDLKKAEQTGKLPNFIVMALPWDHTHGLSPGSHTPNAMVADNDLAVGQLVEGLSRSKFWAKTAVFVIQDDAQSSPDHVDAHRTIGQVISPYTKLGVTDSNHYTTCSMLRTMELILGLPPLTQYTKHANPMLSCFRGKLDLTPYTAIEPSVDRTRKNPATGSLAARSQRLDWSERDKADPYELNLILWEAIKGKTPMPAPVVGLVRGR